MKTPKKIIDLEKIIAKHAMIKTRDFYSRKRMKHYCQARFILWYLLYHELEYTLTYIADLYNRSHSTIYSGIKNIEEDPVLMAEIERFKNKYAPKSLYQHLTGRK